MLPLFFIFFERDGVLFSLSFFFLHLEAFSTQRFFCGGGSAESSLPSPVPSASSSVCIFLFISNSLPMATILHRLDSKPLTLQKVSGARSSWLGETIFFEETIDSVFSSSGQHTTQKVVVGLLSKVRKVILIRQKEWQCNHHAHSCLYSQAFDLYCTFDSC